MKLSLSSQISIMTKGKTERILNRFIITFHIQRLVCHFRIKANSKKLTLRRKPRIKNILLSTELAVAQLKRDLLVPWYMENQLTHPAVDDYQTDDLYAVILIRMQRRLPPKLYLSCILIFTLVNMPRTGLSLLFGCDDDY